MAENVLFFFSALGVFNALLLAALLLLKSRRSPSLIFHSLLLLLLVIRVGVSCFHYFGDVPEGAIKLGLFANLLLGPTMMLLMRSSFNPGKSLLVPSVSHFGFWTVLFFVSWLLFDFQTWDWKIRFVIHASLVTYLVYTALYWRKSIFQLFGSSQLAGEERRSIVAYLSLVLICLGFALSLVTNYILGPLLFSIIFYATAGYLLLADGKSKAKMPAKKIADSDFSRLNQRLTELMEKEQLYRDTNISLESLAGRLAVSRHLLSQMLNENLKKNFYQYINKYRVEEACEMLSSDHKYSIEAIGYEVGFNSRSSFFTSFKQIKGITPSKYREEQASV